MLFRILKLFGIDIAGRIAEIRTAVESQAELAQHRLARALKEMSVFISLFILAALAGTAALGVGLTALYSWVALKYGEFYGYAAVGGILVLVAAVCGVTGLLQAKSWSLQPSSVPEETSAASTDEAADDLPYERHPVSDVDEASVPAVAQSYRSPTPARQDGLFSSGLVTLPVTGNPVVDSVIEGLRVPAGRAVEDVLELATDTIRRGEREKLIATVGFAVLVGWLVERTRSRHVASR